MRFFIFGSTRNSDSRSIRLFGYEWYLFNFFPFFWTGSVGCLYLIFYLPYLNYVFCLCFQIHLFYHIIFISISLSIYFCSGILPSLSILGCFWESSHFFIRNFSYEIYLCSRDKKTLLSFFCLMVMLTFLWFPMASMNASSLFFYLAKLRSYQSISLKNRPLKYSLTVGIFSIANSKWLSHYCVDLLRCIFLCSQHWCSKSLTIPKFLVR
jgi:hypothetical protein